MRVLILSETLSEAARPDEEDVHLQIATVRQALMDLGHIVFELTVGLHYRDEIDGAITHFHPDVVFNLVEALAGRAEGIYLPVQHLEVRGVPFTGCSPAALRITTDKVRTKELLSNQGICTPLWYLRDALSCTSIVERSSWIMKPIAEDASVGIDRGALIEASESSDLLRALEDREQKLGVSLFVEEFIAGREVNISVLEGPSGPEVLPIAEIDFSALPHDYPHIVDYDAKWTKGSISYENTPRVFTTIVQENGLHRELSALTLQCWDALQLSGYGRVDFRVSPAGVPFVIEVNANPCLSLDAGFPAAAREAGISFGEMIQRIVSTDGQRESTRIVAEE